MAFFTILGASGFIGGKLAAKLSNLGHEVATPARNELPLLAGRDIGHAIYCLGVEHAGHDPFGAFEAHVEHLARMLRSCRFLTLTYLSSTRLYLGASTAREDSKLQIHPDDANAIFNITKIAGEQLCLATENPSVRVVRPSNVVGFAPNGKSLIPILVRDAIQRRHVYLTIAPESAKDYVAVEDLCDLLPRIALDGRFRCYNLASGFNISLGEIVALVRSEFPSGCDWRPNSSPVVFPPIDIERIREEFAFKPRPVRDSFVTMFQQYRHAGTSSWNVTVDSQ